MKELILTLAITTASTAASTVPDNLDQYPMVISLCDGYVAKLNDKRDQIPVGIPKAKNKQFINDMYQLCLAGGRSGVAFGETGKKRKPLTPPPADTRSNRQLSKFMTNTYNYGQKVGESAANNMKKSKTAKQPMDDLFANLTSRNIGMEFLTSIFIIFMMIFVFLFIYKKDNKSESKKNKMRHAEDDEGNFAGVVKKSVIHNGKELIKATHTPIYKKEVFTGVSVVKVDELNNAGVVKVIKLYKNKELIEKTYNSICKKEIFSRESVVKVDEINSAEVISAIKSQEHNELIGKEYKLQCKENVFTDEELDILNMYGAWLSALVANKIRPETPMQKKFVQECRHFRELPVENMLIFYKNHKNLNSIQATWFKYLCRIKIERENPIILEEDIRINWGWQGPPLNSHDHVLFFK
ncbi:hypothetical protein O1Y80_000810 [Yersinia enterocolitica]|nr:hypothetical protein [Yersinia enterocolitica]EKN3831220.1 hypothetical protein [Yersinia enterocolitica]